VRDFEKSAHMRLTESAFNYYRSGANGMISLNDAERAYDKF